MKCARCKKYEVDHDRRSSVDIKTSFLLDNRSMGVRFNEMLCPTCAKSLYDVVNGIQNKLDQFMARFKD